MQQLDKKISITSIKISADNKTWMGVFSPEKVYTRQNVRFKLSASFSTIPGWNIYHGDNNTTPGTG
jgi:hypothetical protein